MQKEDNIRHKPLQELTLLDRFLFREAMENPVCEEFPDIRLKDGSCRMFINTKGANREGFSEEFLELMEYINAPPEEAEKYTTTEAVRKIHEEIIKLKQREEMGVKYMQSWEERVYDRMEAREEGERIGTLQKAVQVVKNAMDKLGLPLEAACDLAEITVESYREYVGGTQNRG